MFTSKQVLNTPSFDLILYDSILRYLAFKWPPLEFHTILQSISALVWPCYLPVSFHQIMPYSGQTCIYFAENILNSTFLNQNKIKQHYKLPKGERKGNFDIIQKDYIRGQPTQMHKLLVWNLLDPLLCSKSVKTHIFQPRQTSVDKLQGLYVVLASMMTTGWPQMTPTPVRGQVKIGRFSRVSAAKKWNLVNFCRVPGLHFF